MASEEDVAGYLYDRLYDACGGEPEVLAANDVRFHSGHELTLDMSNGDRFRVSVTRTEEE